MSEPWTEERMRRDGTKYERREHPEDCTCTRCRGFTAGEGGTASLAPLKHGAYATLAIRGRAEEIANELRAAAIREDIYRPSFDAMLQLAAVALARVERAAAALSAVEEELDEAREKGGSPLASYFPGASDEGRAASAGMDSLRRDMRGWMSQAARILNDLGMSPRALAAISRDSGIGKATRATAALRELDAHLDAAYPKEIEE